MELIKDTLELENEPKKEYVVTEERRKMMDSILAVYSECFQFSRQFLVGKVLKEKYESVEKTMRQYRKIQETKLESARKELYIAEKDYKQAVKTFEQMSLEELDPSKYDEIVAPVEAKYNSLLNIVSNLTSVIQNIKMLTSKVFAKDKTQTLSMIHAHAIYLTLKLITVFNKEGSIGVQDENFNQKVLPNLEYIRDNYSSILSGFDNNSSIDDIVDFLHPIAEHSADQAAMKSRQSKDQVFKCIDDICEKYNIDVITPERNGENDLEYELLVKGNQVKALTVLVKGKPVKRPDGKYSYYPSTSKDKAEIVESLREARYYLSGITTIMSEEFISQLPLRDQSIKRIYMYDIPRLTKVVLDIDSNDNTDITTQKLLISHVLMTLSIVDQIPTLILYI